MSLVTLAQARLHLRHDSGTSEDSLIQTWLDVAERQIMEYLNRSVYEDQATLDAAIAAASATLTTARGVYEDAIEALDAMDLTDNAEYDLRKEAIEVTYADAQRAYTMAVNGMVVNDSIKAAILLLTAYLFETRSPAFSMHLAQEFPTTLRHLVVPWRIGMGM